MSDVRFRSDVTVDLIDQMGGDLSVVRSARVSTGTESVAAGDEKLIGFLMRNRHGTPFEHTAFTFRIEAPIFVWREFMRHRIGVSYNEESGRYKQLEPVFYVPAVDRPLVQVGKAGAYEFEMGDLRHHMLAGPTLEINAHDAYKRYTGMLKAGIAREVARMVLPVNIYSSAYVTMNARALMNFLSLRTKVEGSAFPSFPQREIEMVAEKMEEIFATLMPVTYQAFDNNGRVAP